MRGAGCRAGVAADHDPRMRRIEPHARRGLETAVVDETGNARIQRAGARLARDHGNVPQPFRRHGRRQALRDRRDLVAIGELIRVADAVHQDDALEGRPRRRVAQDRDERTEAGTARQQPQVAPRREVVDGQEAIGRHVHAHRGAGLDSRQPIGERTAGNEHGDELEKGIVRRRHDRERPPDPRLFAIAEAEPRVVAGLETESRTPAGAERQEPRRPVAHQDQLLGREPGGRLRWLRGNDFGNGVQHRFHDRSHCAAAGGAFASIARGVLPTRSQSSIVDTSSCYADTAAKAI